MIFVEDGDIHMLEGRLVGLLVVDVEGGHCLGCGEGEGISVAAGVGCSRTKGICLYTVHASLFQCNKPLTSS